MFHKVKSVAPLTYYKLSVCYVFSGASFGRLWDAAVETIVADLVCSVTCC